MIHTTLDLHITAGFVRTGSDVPSLSVMSLKMKKIIGAGLKPIVKDHITPVCGLNRQCFGGHSSLPV